MTRYVLPLEAKFEYLIVFQINKTADRMYALFAICHALAPGRVDDAVHSTTKEKFGEQLTKMMRG
jgi:translation initiation factor 3 subunit L